jgi:hypothetical protein
MVFGIFMIILAAIIFIVSILIAIAEEEGEAVFFGIMLAAIPLAIGICAIECEKDREKSSGSSPKVEVVQTTNEPKEMNNLLTIEFFQAAGFSGSYGQYDLIYPFYYDVANHQIIYRVHDDFEDKEYTIFDEITTIDQLREFYKLHGEEEEFNVYLKRTEI